jgi:hypothetical protein
MHRPEDLPVRVFSELYVRNLANTLFYLFVGVSSTMGNHILVSYLIHDNIYAILSASIWAIILIMIYSDIIARRENQYLLLAQSFDFHRTLRPDNRIGAVVPVVTPPQVVPVAEPEPIPEKTEKKLDISKIEVVHTMDRPMDLTRGKTA